MDAVSSDAQVDQHSINIVRNLIVKIEPGLAREGLRDTPDRVVKSWETLYGGYKMNPGKILSTQFMSEGYDQMVLLKNIEFYSTCEHHMLPFFGKIHIAYLPKKSVVGLSKLARIVECYSRRLQIQERMTKQIGEIIKDKLQPDGVGVVVEAMHMCMVSRGVQKQNASMTTSYLGGKFRERGVRNEFLSLIKP